jgi:DNA-binding transcriptional regulator LsrR (DeoR family)
MFYQEHRSQAEISSALGISPATVNRMVKEGHERGFVEIRIHTPFGPEAGLAASLKQMGHLKSCVAVHSQSSDPAIVLRSVADAAANALLDDLQDGMTIAVSGGVAMTALIDALKPARRFAIRVVPATGGVQGKFHTDVNHVAVALAEKLGGTALQLHAPVFGASPEERQALLSVSTIANVLDIARKADIAVFGIGSVQEDDSTYLTLTDHVDRSTLIAAGASGELLAHVINDKGEPCDHISNRCLVALSLEDLGRIPNRVAMASGAKKAIPIAAALRGGRIGTLITDGNTARTVVDLLGGPAHAA